MALRAGIWRQWQRRGFAVALADTGDPQQAAVSVKRTLFEAYALRRTSAEFATAWDEAMAIAWEQLENRALARLLAGIEVAEKAADDAGGKAETKPKARAPLDSRLALALLQRRKPPAGQRVVPDSRKVAAIRAELRALESYRD